MRLYSLVFRIPLILILIIISIAAGSALPVKYKTTGVYTDRNGTQHPWSINDAHTLIWENSPYIPVGGIFTSRYLSFEANEDNYQADIKALDAIKSKGITDIILKSTKPITAVNPDALQRILDYLDANGFTYGLEMNDGPKKPLSGSLVSPDRYLLEGPIDEMVITRALPDVDSAFYLVVNKVDRSIAASGNALVLDGKLTINLSEPLGAGKILVVYPHKTFKSVDEGGIGDIWSGFGEFRDRLLAYFKNIKFGPGLRFFIEPFASKMDFTGEMAGFVPDTSGFRLGFEAFLIKRHSHESALRVAWGFIDDIDKMEKAVKMLPLWYSGRGVGYFYDIPNAELVKVDISSSGVWRDIIDYRDSSVQEYMNVISDIIKKQIANVPVIFKNNKYHRIYANPYGMGGFDGLGAVAYGSAEQPVKQVTGPAYSLAEESGKTTWFIIAATQTSSDKKTLVGYSNESAMIGTLDLFREVGAKGFFIDSLQALPEETRGNFSLLKDPQQIDWLSNFKNRLKSLNLAEFKPTVINYPIFPEVGASVKRLAPNTWWLPTLRMGKTSYIGDGLSAYTITPEDRSYIWSNIGPKTVTMRAGPTGYPSLVFPESGAMSKKKNNLFTLSLTDAPVVIKGIDFNFVFPQETAIQEIERLKNIIPEADKLGLDVKQARAGLENAQNVLKNGQPMIAFGIAETELRRLLSLMGSDIWLEGEKSPAHNFDRSSSAEGASGGVVLLVDTDEDPPFQQYTAAYVLNADINSSYELWIAATPPSDSSPVSYNLDDLGWNPINAADVQLQNYAHGLAWYKIGTANLFPGKHVLKLRVDGRRPQDNRYYFAIDALVASPRGFKPNGVNKPY